MQYARLGSSGLKVSRIGLGMMSYGNPAALAWSLPEEGAAPIVPSVVVLATKVWILPYSPLARGVLARAVAGHHAAGAAAPAWPRLLPSRQRGLAHQPCPTTVDHLAGA
jgi:aryl-alcohol dehydrogenase-like predicted oxidoreductase